MSALNAKEEKGILTKEEFDDLMKKMYGLNNKDIEEIYVFVNDFNEVMREVPDVATYEDLKPVVDKCNKIPSHTGFMVIQYFVNFNGDNAFNKVMLSFYNNYKEQFEEDAKSTKTSDLYETLACFISFAPSRTLRKFITDNFEISKEIYKAMRKRPGTDAVMSSRYAELFVTSKFDKKYGDLIYENFKAMIDFLNEKNGEMEQIQDVVKINYNELRDIMIELNDNGKKESLKRVNKIINKKADIGEAFFYFVVLNSSCAIELFVKDDRFSPEFLSLFFYQLKVQYVAELMTYFENMPLDKQPSFEYLKNSYKLSNYDDCYEKVLKLVDKGGLSSYGPLLRQVPFFPNIHTFDSEDIGDASLKLQQKLSAVANNLTADMSEKSMSITIVPLGRSRTYQDIMDKIEGFDENGGASSFVAKMRDKDIIKKIRESGLSWYALDQECGAFMIITLQEMSNVYKKNKGVDVNSFIKLVYKEIVLKHGIIVTLPYFRFLIESLMEKYVDLNDNQDDTEEDYEDIE